MQRVRGAFPGVRRFTVSPYQGIEPSMADNLTAEQRRRNMQAIRSKNTSPEMSVRKFLHRNGFRYRLHVRSLPGSPDIVLRRYSTVVFVHGCFWHQHGCVRTALPKSRKRYWKPKLLNNIARHAEQVKQLHALGWRAITVWECQIRGHALQRKFKPLLAKRG